MNLPVTMDVASVAGTPSMGSTSSVRLLSQSEAVSKTDETPESHKCPYKACGKFFSKKYNLKAHLRLHTGEQPFECPRPDCNKKFKWRSSLSSHSVWHTRKDAGIAVGTGSQSDNAVAKSNTTFGNSRMTDLSTITASEISGKDIEVPNAATVGKKAGPKRKRPRSVKGGNGRAKSQKAPSVATPAAISDMDIFGPELPFARTSIDQGPSKKRKQSSVHSTKNIAPVCPMPLSVPNVIDTIAAALNAAMDTSGAEDVSAAVENQIFDVIPGSPVTSDGDISEKSLDVELFNGTLLPPLSTVTGTGAGKMGADLLLEEGDVDAILGNTAELFPCPSSSTGALQGLDTRFGPFELDNLQSFYLGKVEGL